MKKIIIGVVIVAVVFAFIYFRKKIGNTQYLKPSASNFKFNINSVTDIATGILNGFDADAVLTIKNFSTTKYNISALKGDVFTTDGTIIAEQINPMNAPFDILPGASVVFPMKYKINAGALAPIVKQLGKNNVMSLLMSYLNDRTIGANVQIKGFFVSEGIQFDLNETTKI